MTQARLSGAALIFIVSTANLAQAASVIDQQQPIIDASVGGLGIGGAGTQKLAQIVTTAIS